MLDLGWSEILVIAIVLIVVIGPKDLPRVLRTFGRTTSKMRTMANDFRRQFDEAMREAELDEVKNLVQDVKKLDPHNEVKKHLSPLEKAGQDIRKELDQAAKPKTPASPAPKQGAAGGLAKPAQPAVSEAASTAEKTSKPAVDNASAAGKKPAARKTAAGKSTASKAATAKPAARGSKNKKTAGTAT